MSRSDSTDTGPDNIRNGDTVDHASGVIPVTLVIPVHVTVSVGSVTDLRNCNSNNYQFDAAHRLFADMQIHVCVAEIFTWPKYLTASLVYVKIEKS